MNYKIKELASLAGVSVRTLHHYDKIGILKPTKVNESGYRFYSNENLEKLQQILFFKELDFSLHEIKKILNSPEFDRKESLIIQRKLLIEKKERIEKIIDTVDMTITSIEGGFDMSKREMFDSFDMTEIEKYKNDYADEVRQKYDNKVVEESQMKTNQYSKDDWIKIKNRGDEIFKQIAALMDRETSDSEVQRLIGDYRQYITDNFYDCTLEIFSGLGELYINDPRFTINIDKNGDGLSKFLHDGIKIYCANN